MVTVLKFFRKQKTSRTLQKLLTQVLVDKFGASYDIPEVENVIFLCHCTKN